MDKQQCVTSTDLLPSSDRQMSSANQYVRTNTPPSTVNKPSSDWQMSSANQYLCTNTPPLFVDKTTVNIVGLCRLKCEFELACCCLPYLSRWVELSVSWWQVKWVDKTVVPSISWSWQHSDGWVRQVELILKGKNWRGNAKRLWCSRNTPQPPDYPSTNTIS